MKIHRLFILVALATLNVIFSAEAADVKNASKLAVANNELGVKLYRRFTQNDDGNIFFSPFSLSTAFGMLFVGTGGNSAKQLRCALGYNAAHLLSKKVPCAFNQYLNKVLHRNKPDDDAYVLNLANELLISEHFEVNPDYKKEVQNFFHAYIEEVDFADNTDQVIKEVNDWVNQQTHGKIDKILTSLDKSTLLLILNAIYFKGTWLTQFDKKLTSDGEFYNHGQENEAKSVPFMHIKSKFPYFETDDYQVVELPYKGKDISMMILLPKSLNGLEDIGNRFAARDIKNFHLLLQNTTLNLSLPKFKIEYSREVTSDFKALGAKDIFDNRLADFSGITQVTGLAVTQVLHKAAIEVNEEGSEAAASTVIVIGPRTVHRDPVFVADHPFLFAIFDKRNYLALFFGRVSNF